MLQLQCLAKYQHIDYTKQSSISSDKEMVKIKTFFCSFFETFLYVLLYFEWMQYILPMMQFIKQQHFG